MQQETDAAPTLQLGTKRRCCAAVNIVAEQLYAVELHSRIEKVLPAAIAVCPMLNDADVYQPIGANGRLSDVEQRRYVVNLRFGDEDQCEVDAWLKECLSIFGLEHGKLPWTENKKTGERTLMATSDGYYRPIAFDADENEVPGSVKIGGGSKLKVCVSAKSYAGFGGGINLLINSYQILELKQIRKTPFEKGQGYIVPR